MGENNSLGSSGSFDLETSLPPQQHTYLLSLNAFMKEARTLSSKNNHLSSESSSINSSLNQSLGSPMDFQETKSSIRSEFRRSSLCRQFDPLHTSYHILASCEEESGGTSTDASKSSNMYLDAFGGDVQKDTVTSDVSDLSSENVLMSFESPKKPSDPEFKRTFNDVGASAKRYTEKEFNQILRAHELHLQGELLRKHHDLETSFTEKDHTLEHENSRISKINNFYLFALSEMINVLQHMVSYNNELEDKIKFMEVENEKLKEDITTSKEDLSEWESTFSEFHKRYEQGKSMLKSCKENEELLQRNIENFKLALVEKNKKFNLLEARTQECTDKAQKEIESVKKSGDAQIAMLGAQLKKAEMKIFSLENYFNQGKLQNHEMGNICNDLMSKIGK